MPVTDEMVFSSHDLLHNVRRAELIVSAMEDEALIKAGYLVYVFGYHSDIMRNHDNAYIVFFVQHVQHLIEALLG